MTLAPKRRWFRFSLREILLATTAIGCALGWAIERWRHPYEMTLRQAIEMLSGTDEIQVDCRLEDPDNPEALPVKYWLVRKRPNPRPGPATH
jgi:hypothetical protein